MSVTILRSHRPDLWDRGMVIDVQVYNVFKKKIGFTDCGMVIGVC